MPLPLQSALFTALVACLLGMMLCRAVVASAHKTGVYEGGDRAPFTIVRSREPDRFSAALVGWKVSARAFATGALMNGVAWGVLKVLEG